MHGHSAAKCYHCLSKRFVRTSQNWRQKSSERHDPQQINLKEENWLKLYRLKWDEMQTLGCKILSLFVKKNPTDNTKLGTKIIRKTQSTANQFDAETLIQAVQTKVERHAQTVSYNMLLLFVKEIPTDITKLETKIIKYSIHKKSISCRHIETRSWTRIETKITQSQLKHYHCSSKRFLYTSRNWNQKSQPRTQSTVKQSDAGTLTETMSSDVQRNARTFSCKMLSLFVKEIPTDIRKLETKIIRKTRSTANQFDAGTLTQAVQTKVERHAQTVSYNMLLLFVKKIPTDITKLATKIIRKTRSTANQFDAGTLTEALQTELERNAQTVSNKMLSLFVKEIPTDIMKLETKIIRKTRSTASQFDAATLTEVLQTEVGRNAQTLGCKMLPLFVKKNPTVITKLEGKTFCQITTKLETKIIRKNTIHSQSI